MEHFSMYDCSLLFYSSLHYIILFILYQIDERTGMVINIAELNHVMEVRFY